MMAYGIVVNGKCIAYDGVRYHGGDMKTDKDWEDQAKGLLKAELKRRGITYAQLVGKLADVGVMDSEPNVRNKLARGKFTAVFLIQCLEAIGASSLRLSDG
jgi:hypothetical protein